MGNWITSRRLSALVVLIYIAVFCFAASSQSATEVVKVALPLAGYFLLPLVCIWYGDELGEYVGTFPGPAINRRTPGWMLKVAGWFLLFLPAAVISWLAFQSS